MKNPWLFSVLTFCHHEYFGTDSKFVMLPIPCTALLRLCTKLLPFVLFFESDHDLPLGN